MRFVELYGGRGRTIVDDEDYEAVAAHSWHLHTGGYAHRAFWVDGRNRITYLHRWLLGLQKGDSHVDHINGDKLDNRRRNLRLATISQNAQNMLRPTGVSGYRNVYWHARTGKWKVQVCVQGRRISGGYFDELADAIPVAARLRRERLPFAEREAA